jgi:hypothetical protein
MGHATAVHLRLGDRRACGVTTATSPDGTAHSNPDIEHVTCLDCLRERVRALEFLKAELIRQLAVSDDPMPLVHPRTTPDPTL